MPDTGSFSKRMKRRFLNEDAGWRLPSTSTPLPSAGTHKGSLTANLTFTGSVDAGGLLGTDERGAVWPILPAEALAIDGQLKLANYPLPHEDIRTCLLFFDRFDVPSSSEDGKGFDWCESEFQKIGILLPSRWEGEGNLTDVLRLVPFYTFLARDRVEPGRWTMARPVQALGIPEGALSPQAGIALTLQNALPTFAREVELEDVMEFKRRSWSELIALRNYLDNLVKEAAYNGVLGFQHSDAYRRFKEALGNHIRLMNESNHRKIWRSLKASCDLPTALAPVGEFAFTGSIDYGTLATGAIMLGVRTVQGLREKRDPVSPFEYLTSANLAL